MPLYQLKNKIDVFKTLDNKKSKQIKEQLFKSYIKFFILCNKFKDYQLVDNDLNIITNKEEYLNNESMYEKRKNIDIKMINTKTNEYFFVCCRYYDEEQLLKYYNLAEMHYQVNQYKQFHIDNYKNINRNNIDINNETQQDKKPNKKTDETNDSDNEEFYEPDEIQENSKELLEKSFKKSSNETQQSEIIKSSNEIKKSKPKYKLGLFVKSKQEFLKKYNNSKSSYLMSIIDPEEDVYDYQYFLNIANSFEFKDFMLITNKKEILLRNYQQDIISQIKPKNNILNICPNIGSHFILSEFILKRNIKNVLVLDTDTKWNNIFENYYGFDDYNIKHIENKNELINISKNLKNKNIIFISKKLFLVNYPFISNYKPILVICNNPYYLQYFNNDKIVFNTINKLKSQYNIFISHHNVKVENTNIINFNFNKLKYYELRNHWKVFDDVDKYPNQIIIYPDFKDEKYTNFLQEMVCDNINFNELFEIKNDKFFNSIMVNKFITSFISNKEFTTDQNTVYENLYNTNYNYNLVSNKDSQIWILPKDNFEIVANLLVNILSKDYHYKFFDYLIINNTQDVDLINNQIIEKENNIQEHYCKGLIILTNGILEDNVIIKNCSSIVFMHNDITYNEYELFMYKCLNNHNNKRNIIMIGFNTDIYQLLYNFNDGIHNFENENDKIKYIVKNNLFYINKNPYINKTLKKLKIIIKDYKQKLVGCNGYFNTEDKDDEKRKEQIELQNKFYDLQYKEIEYNKLKTKFYDADKVIDEIINY